MTNVIILTGFLGAGKTTTLNHVLKSISPKDNVAVIVNEFAVIGVDGKMLDQDGVEVKQLSNGCVCCSKKGELEETLKFLQSNYKPDTLIIETSGVASLEPLVQTLQDAGATLSGVSTVVDAKRFADSADFGKIALKQIQLSSFIIINKTDLVSKDMLEYMKKKLRSLNPTAEIVATTNGQIDFKQFNKKRALKPVQFKEASALIKAISKVFPAFFLDDTSKHIQKSGVSSVSYETKSNLRRSHFDSFINNLPRSIFRAKGFVKFAGEKESYKFQYATGLVTFEEHVNEGPNQIVVIGKMSIAKRIALISTLNGMRETPRISEMFTNLGRLLK